MRKKHWLKITLITLAICAAAGVVLSVVLFYTNPERTGASSSVEFAFEGAAEGKAPNGYRYDVNGIQSDEVLEAALKDTGMEEKYTVDQLRMNLFVSGVYPGNIVEQMTNYESILTGDAGKVSVGDYHATLFNVTLYNDFDKDISKEDLEKLLEAIMTEFRENFTKNYSLFLAKDTMLDNLSEYDYPQQLEILSGSISRNARYAQDMAEEHPDFLMNGEGFADIAVRFESLQSIELDRINGLVTMNALSKDLDRIVAQYENEIKVLSIRLKELQTESESIEAFIEQYNKDDIIYVSTSNALQKVGSSSSDTYDTLIARRQEISDNMVDLNQELTQVQLKLSDIRGGEASDNNQAAEESAEPEETESANTAEFASAEDRESQIADVEKSISTVLTKLRQITEKFTSFLKAYSESEINERTVAISAVRYSTPKLVSGAFVKHVIKTAGPLCVIGLMICIAVMIVSQRRARRKADK